MNKQTYSELIVDYSQAKNIVEAYLKNLQELNPAIDSVETRIKTLESIEGKCKEKNIAEDETSIREHIRDIAGARVTCQFRDEILKVVEAIRDTPGIAVEKEKDYLTNPKDNGYSSYHLCCSVQVRIPGKGTKSVPVEIQVRSMAQNLWASAEHFVSYKTALRDDPETKASFARIAKLLEEIDEELIKLRDNKNPA